MAATTADLPQFQSPESVLNALRGKGLRVSTARRLVVHTLFAAERPLSAGEIAAGLDEGPAHLDLASVYRNLETLEQLGYVSHFHVGAGPGRYLFAAGKEREYIACERCGSLVEADPRELDGIRAEIVERFGYEVRFNRFPVIGLCADCAGE
ncbi:MAG: transcriptional repressor [Actinomycetota bacterium]